MFRRESPEQARFFQKITDLSREELVESLLNRIEQIKMKKPAYGVVLDFYGKIKEAQEKIEKSVEIGSIELKQGWKEAFVREGFPLIEKQNFLLDVEASSRLFRSLCRVAAEATPLMAEGVQKIAEALVQKRLDIKRLFRDGFNEKIFEEAADRLNLDKKVFLFLVLNSIKPSVEANVERLRPEVDQEAWLKGYCPICGSLPCLSLLKEETGKRYLVCSFCSYQWPIERLLCPFCGNKDQGSLRYLYTEDEESHRIDICEKCHQYIKTIDLRKTEAPDLSLEDLATLHLDMLASQEGYRKPIPNLQC